MFYPKLTVRKQKEMLHSFALQRAKRQYKCIKACFHALKIRKAFISGLSVYTSSQGLFFSKTNSWSSAYRSSIFIRMENESSRNMARRFIVYAVCGQVQIGNQLSN